MRVTSIYLGYLGFGLLDSCLIQKLFWALKDCGEHFPQIEQAKQVINNHKSQQPKEHLFLL